MLCSTLAAEQQSRFSGCANAGKSKNCDADTLHYCDCIAIQPISPGSEAYISNKLHDMHTQALLQFVLSVISLLSCIGFMLCYMLLPGRMWKYPLNLAFWIYACDLLVALQFAILSATALSYSSSFHRNTTMLEFDQYYPVATSPACLCDFDSGHPGCACRGGVLSFMLQVGLIGGILFTCSLTHNLYRSVDDPFTRPSSRLPRYHVVNWCLVLLFSVPFLIPPSHDANHPNEMSGYGYQSAYQMCWSPVRYGPSLVNNFQMLFLATLPICTTWFFAPLFLCLAKRLLGQGGASVRSMLKQRERQVQQATFLLFVHLGHWFLVGLFYSCSALSLDSDPLGE